LSFARRQYSTICVDLSGMMERYSVEVLHEAKQVFLVATSELPVLHLAREKLAFLRSQDLGKQGQCHFDTVAEAEADLK
jgi:hypothetical protein